MLDVTLKGIESIKDCHSLQITKMKPVQKCHKPNGVAKTLWSNRSLGKQLSDLTSMSILLLKLWPQALILGHTALEKMKLCFKKERFHTQTLASCHV